MRLTPPPPTTPSFEKSAIPLLLTVKPSRAYISAIVALHCLAVAALVMADIPAVIEFTLTVLVVVSLIYNLHQETRTTKLIWRAGNRWSIEHQNRPLQAATLHSVDFVSRWLVIITLKPAEARRQRLVIPFDSVGKDSYRLFRVRLRIEAHSLLNPNSQAQ